MMSRSCFNLLNLNDDHWSDRSRSPKAVSVPDSEEGFQSDAVSRRIIVANKLPLNCRRNDEGEKWSFDWDEDALVLQLKDGFPPNVEVLYVGCLGVHIDPVDQENVAQLLLDKFKCVPAFLPLDVMEGFYHGFCKHYLWPLFHNMLPLTPDHGLMFDKNKWLSYVTANMLFAEKLLEVISPDDDYVWIHDYHLLLLPTILRRKFHRVKLGFFLHSPFPSSEIYRTLPVRLDLLRGLLNCDLVGFHTFDYARHFLSCCSRMLGLDYQSKRGYIGLDYYGRTVSVKILPVGIHMGQIQSVVSSPDTWARIQELREEYKDKTVLLGVDDVDVFKGIGLKFVAFCQLLEKNESFRGKVVLVQIMNKPRSQGKDIQEVQAEIERAADEVNTRYGKEDYCPIVCVQGPVSFQEKVAYYSISECVVVNAVRDGMNLVPYKYTVARQGCPDVESPKKSVIILSEFIGCSPSLSGAIRVNPWDISSVAEAMASGIKMSDDDKKQRHEKHYKYVVSHDVAYWARSFDQDLKRACMGHSEKRCWGIGFGLNTRVVALGPNFQKLAVEHILEAYKNTNSRLILLDYDGTMTPQDRQDKSPSSEVISVLNGLCNDPKNTVFIVSGRGKDSLGRWFGQCERLGLSAEHGYCTRWTKDSEWESLDLVESFDWKKIVLPLMEQYTEATDGSWIEQKESALVWHYQEADPDFGPCQAKEILDHLESVLANDPVVVKSGQHIVEVKPQGVSKGVVAKNLIEAMKMRGKSADFIFCIGDDRSDEDMFEAIASSQEQHSLPDTAEVFACTVGQKPSMAKYYLDKTSQVIKRLQALSAVSGPQIPPSRPCFV